MDMFSRIYTADSLTLISVLIILGSSLCIGFFISFVYILIHKKELYSSNFTVALIMLPSIIAMIIVLVGNNTAAAFSLVGAFSLIRFRSVPCNAKDLSYMFFALGLGLACGVGYIGYAVLFAVILCIIMSVLAMLKFDKKNKTGMQLKITMPEDMDYQGVNDILDKYALGYKLMRVKTSEFGSLFELNYRINLQHINDGRDLIDKLRTKNGNLNISLIVDEMDEMPLF